jgi:murein tripeptide amidase MpaA
MKKREVRMLAQVALALACALTAGAEPQDPARTAVLPPEPPWSGHSRSLAAPADDPWATPCERSGFRRTPRYEETVEWLRRLAAAAPELQLVSLGRTPEGREIWMVAASRERAFTPEALRRSGKPTLFAHAGIHAGEIDGKDAGLMLLRDMTVRGARRDLLEHANVLFVPILNVDGHERFSAFTRINQTRTGRGRLAHERAKPQPQPRFLQARHARGARGGGRARPLVAGPVSRPARDRRMGSPV